MRQDVTCLRCKHVSTTFQHFMDLLLDIRQASNIEEALSQYFRQERIGGNAGDSESNMYKCEKCKSFVPFHHQPDVQYRPISIRYAHSSFQLDLSNVQEI